MTPDPRILGVMARQHGLITFRQLGQYDVFDRDVVRLVRRGDWVRVRQGVYAERRVWDGLDPYRGQPLLRVRAADLMMRLDHWFSHESAALVHGVPLADARSALVHVTRPRVLGSRTKAGVNHHKADFLPEQALVVDGLPVLDLARTACDLARGSGLTAGLAACDHALRHGVTRDELYAAAAAMTCWRHVRTVLTCVDLADGGAESFGESASRALVHELGIGTPTTQFGLHADGRTVFCDLRVGRHVFEFDGHVKYRRETEGGLAREDADRVVWREKRRQDFICGFKLGMSRLTYHDLYAGRAEAKRRLAREYADTVARFGTSVDDLAPYVVHKRR